MTGVSAFLARLERRWRRRRVAAMVVPAAVALAPLAVLVTAWAGLPWWWLPAIGAAIVFSCAAWAGRPPVRSRLLERLDCGVPELEHSAELLVAEPSDLMPVQRLQRRRIDRALSGLEVAAVPLPGLSGSHAAALAVVGLGLAAAAWGAVSFLPPAGMARGGGSPTDIAAPGAGPASESALRLGLEIQPPEYTGLEPWGVADAGGRRIRIPEGARLWLDAGPVGPGERAVAVFDDERLPLGSESEVGASSNTRRGAELVLERSRLVFAERLRKEVAVARTKPAKLEMIADREPRIQVAHPDAFTLLEVPEGADAGRLAVEARIEDDFAVVRTRLVVTVASGTGELVEFRERSFGLPRREGDRADGIYRTALDLDELGVVPGTDLYFHVEAADNRTPVANRARSTTHIVRRPGGSGATAGLGEGLPVFAVPDLFRSQRQIILDTERLLAEADGLGEEELARRSQALGFDQRALRMRYGTLLGEEFVDGRALTDAEDEAEHEDEHGDDDGGLASILPEGVLHEHDVQDLATFFDAGVRTRLRSALAEMWTAEGNLRSIRPREALPSEYRALYLLKQAQERSRIYVQKVGFEAPPLDPAGRRLSGELDRIGSTRVRRRAARRDSVELSEIFDSLSEYSAEPARARSGDKLAGTLDRARRLLARSILAESETGGLSRARPGAGSGSSNSAGSDTQGAGAGATASGGGDDELALLEMLARETAQAAAGETVPAVEIEAVLAALWRRLPEAEPAPAAGRTGSSLFDAYAEELQ